MGIPWAAQFVCDLAVRIQRAVTLTVALGGLAASCASRGSDESATTDVVDTETTSSTTEAPVPETTVPDAAESEEVVSTHGEQEPEATNLAEPEISELRDGYEGNPVDPAGGAAVTSPYFKVEAALFGGVVQPFDDPSHTAEITPPFVKYPDMVTAECVDDGVFGYLQLTITTEAGPRADDVGGDLSPQWGMDLIDVNG
jgi:hypothetical protein